MKNLKLLGVCPISYDNGVAIYGIKNNIDDMVFVGYFGNKRNLQKCKIEYTEENNAYFMFEGEKWFLSEFI